MGHLACMHTFPHRYLTSYNGHLSILQQPISLAPNVHVTVVQRSNCGYIFRISYINKPWLSNDTTGMLTVTACYISWLILCPKKCKVNTYLLTKLIKVRKSNTTVKRSIYVYIVGLRWNKNHKFSFYDSCRSSCALIGSFLWLICTQTNEFEIYASESTQFDNLLS